ncbi:GspH/FimT family pseudopilin [Marinimicrobium alkaliphilum]|uniref:GspH/FimT family pseudopilin n=1 Tax=Marinimicrobium alkaliphilum TaxID=2202654 RepID=UPI0018E06BA2|nr:GspH/FimT family pseudopilin [Marinimicrobium alkaliphilum]
MRKERGFTLIELIVTLAVLAIVAGFAIPGFNSLIQSNRSVALAEDLLSAVNYARSEAVRRGQRVSLCASDNGTSCTGDWVDGWIVVVDTATTDTANAPVVANIDAVLRHWEGPGLNAAITVEQPAGTDRSFIRYTRTGTLARTGNARLQTSIANCASDRAHRIDIRQGGAVNRSRADC